MARNFDVIVLGGGPAGCTAGIRAAELGASVALIESRRLGGTCNNDGCVPVRALAHAARLLREAAQLEQYGISSQPLRADFPNLLARAAKVVREVHDRRDLAGSLGRAGVKLMDGAGEAKFVDPHTVELADGRRLDADKFIVCVGGRPRVPTCPGAELAATLHQFWSLPVQPKRMIIIGAGATGCKLASIMNALGTHVTMLDRAREILGFMDVATGAEMRKAFARRGIEIVGGMERVEEIERVGANARVTYQLGGQRQSVEGDLVVAAIGWPGNADRINPEAAGLTIEKGYITTNDRLQSVSAPHIFAAGDHGGPGMLVQSAYYEAPIAAENAVRGPHLIRQPLILPHGGFSDPEYGTVGLTEEQARRKNPDVLSASVAYEELDRAIIDGRPDGLCKIIVDRNSRMILGAHVVGEDATEIVQIVAAAMAAKMPIEALASVAFSYPTYTAIVGMTARKAMCLV